jgi:DME family drug/metabolite transporter
LSQLRFRLGVLGAAALFSTGGAAIKACSLTGWQVASFRSGVAALFLALVIPKSRRGWSWRTALVGVAYAVTMILFVLGNKLTTAANTIFLQSTAPLYILVAAPFLLKEKIRKTDLIMMAAIACGLGLFFIDLEPASASAPNPFLGNLCGAGAGISYALTLMGLRWLERRDEGGLSAVVVGNLLACLLALPLVFPLAGAGALDWSMIGYLGVIQIGLAYVLLTYGLKKVPAFEASLIILLEPTLNPVWAWLFQDEVPGGLALVGGAIILLSTIAKQWVDQRKAR